MALSAYITLTAAGNDTGPFFSLLSDTDSYTTPFETNTPKAALLAGYTSALVPNLTTIIRIKSIGVCTGYVDVPYTIYVTSPTPTITPSKTASPSLTPSATVTATPVITPTKTPSITITPTATVGTSAPATPSVTTSTTPSVTPVITPSITPTISISPTPTITPSVTRIVLPSSFIIAYGLDGGSLVPNSSCVKWNANQNLITAYSTLVGEFAFVNGHTYYYSDGTKIDGTIYGPSNIYWSDGNVRGTISTLGVFTQTGTCA